MAELGLKFRSSSTQPEILPFTPKLLSEDFLRVGMGTVPGRGGKECHQPTFLGRVKDYLLCLQTLLLPSHLLPASFSKQPASQKPARAVIHISRCVQALPHCWENGTLFRCILKMPHMSSASSFSLQYFQLFPSIWGLVWTNLKDILPCTFSHNFKPKCIL